MFLTDTLGFALLSACFVLQCLMSPVLFRRVVRGFWIAGTVLIGGILLYWAFALYSAWQGNDLTRFFLPPYQSLEYFLLYVRKLFVPWLLSFGAGVFLGWAADRLNRRHGERFFEEGEAALLGLCFFLTGYPTFLWYGLAVLVVGVFLTGMYAVLRRGRAPLYYWWVPTAMFVIILENSLFSESVRNFFVL